MNDDKVTIEIPINAPLEKLWKAWTDPALISKWFGSDPDGKVMNAELDVRTGGTFEVTFKDSDKTEHTCSGVYKDVQEFRKLVFTWAWKSEPGVESLVTVQLTPDISFTRMFFEHARLGTASRHNYLSGWKSTFAKLERVLSIEKAVQATKL